MSANIATKVAAWCVRQTYPKYLLDSAKSKPDQIRVSAQALQPETASTDDPASPPEDPQPSRWRDYWNHRVRTEHRPNGQAMFWRWKSETDFHRLADLVVRETNMKAGDPVIDFGCGSGKILELLSERRDIVGTGFDYSEEAIQWAKEQQGAKFEFRCGSVDNVSFAADESYATVVCFGVVYYLSKDMFEAMVKEMLRVTRPGGHIFIHRITARDVDNYLVVPISYWLGGGEDFGETCGYKLVQSSVLRGCASWQSDDGQRIDMRLHEVLRSYPDYSVMIHKSK